MVWKAGMQWVTRSGVEGLVEIARGGRAMVAVARGNESACDQLLMALMKNILDTLSRCCQTLEMEICYIHPADLSSHETIPEPQQFHLFNATEVTRALQQLGAPIEGRTYIFPCSDLENLSFWSKSVILCSQYYE